MNGITLVAILVSACLAALGQICLKLGAQGQTAATGFVNWGIASGLAFYAIGMLLWLYALSRAPLHVVYPFTLLTLALVGTLGIFILGERPSPTSLVGWAVVVLGVGIVWLGSQGSA
ncbi:DMT family transporter [Methylocella sp. CPCC 101449]|uniref:DMT family transporter n=1 Tax=Methylocella sp. CPCC 101449 TaxID=2987531 RepID=UPI00288C8A90|nr:DMT family transporter [Methylocella sp. CPCC 101449]MDT2023288.1 DMT family transporter [Methylocella sp. CPCC 101449]HEV2574176.1 DMT family transporter [Beijerinckiaceae bacterium]